MNFIINKNNSMFPTYLGSSEYKKGDRIFLVPDIDVQQTFSGTRTNFMGKQITYQGITTAKEYPFRIRATIDNPRDPYLPGVFGTDWVCDEPHAIIEEGSNSNGSYVMYAGGILECNFTGFTKSTTISSTMWSPDSASVNWTLPVVQFSKDFITAYAQVADGRYNWASCNVYVITGSTTKEYINTGSVWFDGNISNDVLVGVFYVKSTWY